MFGGGYLVPPKRQYSDAERKQRAADATRRMKAKKGRPALKAARKRYAATPEGKAVARNSNLVRLYGITSVQYEVIWEAQGRVCAICRRPPKYLDGRRWPVDHDHRTGAVRGVLCVYCNRARLGRGREDPEIMRNVLDYLEHGAERVALTLKTASDWGQS